MLANRHGCLNRDDVALQTLGLPVFDAHDRRSVTRLSAVGIESISKRSDSSPKTERCSDAALSEQRAGLSKAIGLKNRNPRKLTERRAKHQLLDGRVGFC